MWLGGRFSVKALFLDGFVVWQIVISWLNWICRGAFFTQEAIKFHLSGAKLYTKNKQTLYRIRTRGEQKKKRLFPIPDFHFLRYTPNPHAALSTANPHAIPRLSHTTLSLLPLTSFQPMGTSTTGMPAASASISISTSKIQPSECMLGMMYGSAGREKSLKPHWVSWMAAVAGGVRRRRRRWNECIKRLRRKERCAACVSIWLGGGLGG